MKQGKAQRGFTLIELMITIVIIGLLVGLLFVGGRAIRRAAVGTAELQTVNALKTGVETFRNEFGFLPPLVEGRKAKLGGTPRYTTTDGRAVRVVKQGLGPDNAEDRDFLRGYEGGARVSADDFTDPADERYSNQSLSFYLVGALGDKVDGVDGEGYRKPYGDGTFEVQREANGNAKKRQTGRAYPPFFDSAKGGAKLVWGTANDAVERGDVELRAPNGTLYRYYRWLPGKDNVAGVSAAGNADELNIPRVVSAGKASTAAGKVSAVDDAELRGASYAIVAAGADGYFGDLPGEAGNSADKDEMIRALRLPSTASAEQLQGARKDNVVGVGR